MPAILPYLLQTITCSGILYCFYRVAYYNKRHHQWNRFFLLGTVVVSIVLPLIKIHVPVSYNETTNRIIPLLNIIPGNKTEIEGITAAPENNFNYEVLLTIIYVIVSLGLFFLLLRGLFKILMIYTSCPKEKIDNIETVMTHEKNSPFSFFRAIFWNRRIDVHSSIGEKIFEHEKVHVLQLHSIDRLLINFVLTIFWFNPFYWLIKREMVVVHEFVADRKSVEGNAEMFSEMLLMSAYPGMKFGVTSSFFNSSIKRRLTMLTTFNNSKTRYLGKWMLLPVMLIVFAGFTLRRERILTGLKSPFTVVIDAGHGGDRNGTTADDGTREKDLTLAIAKKIKALNSDGHINIIMTREDDANPSPIDRVQQASKLKADAFISIHVNNDPSGGSGIQLMMTKKATEFAGKSRLLGSILSQELAKIYKIDGALRVGRTDDPAKGVWVLDAPEINYASILIECGNMRNDDDLSFVKSEANQEKLARQILNAIKLYAGNKTTYVQQPSAIAMMVEKGRIDLDVKDSKVNNIDFSNLEMLSSKNIFAGEDYSSDGYEIVLVDGMYFSDNGSFKKKLSVRENQKLLIVSTTSKNPWETLVD
ncbi:MAG: N-acetylmuramoyl-L-alanine amidase [Chitinophagaceae bacterium]|nr:N-acetylmuramoyl-L-alanine amidase [Chitinophagaceae bacterium]